MISYLDRKCTETLEQFQFRLNAWQMKGKASLNSFMLQVVSADFMPWTTSICHNCRRPVALPVSRRFSRQSRTPAKQFSTQQGQNKMRNPILHAQNHLVPISPSSALQTMKQRCLFTSHAQTCPPVVLVNRKESMW